MSDTRENEENSGYTISQIIEFVIFLVAICVGVAGAYFGYNMIYSSVVIKIIVHSAACVLFAAMLIYRFGNKIWETIGLIVAIIELVVSILTISLGIGLSYKKDCEVEAIAVKKYSYHSGRNRYGRIFFDYHGIANSVSDKKELTDELRYYNVPPEDLTLYLTTTSALKYFHKAVDYDLEYRTE